jgi:hypothetical protein
MKIKMGYSMGFSGTDSEWTEDIPEEIVAEGRKSIDAYIEETHQYLWSEACEKISVWVEIVE